MSKVTPDEDGMGGVVTIEMTVKIQSDTTPDFKPSIRTAFAEFKSAVEKEEDEDYEGALTSYEEAWRHLKFLSADVGGEMSAYAEDELENVLIRAKFQQVDKRIAELQQWMDGMETASDSTYQSSNYSATGPAKPPALQAQTFRKVLDPSRNSRSQSGLDEGRTPYREEDFVDSMHYTCVTGPPEDFVKNDFKLAVQKMQRSINFAVVITMYNEDENELNSTLRKVANNVKYICTQPRRHDTLWIHDNDAGRYKHSYL